MTATSWVSLVGVFFFAVGAALASGGETGSEDKDRKAILEHIHGIFQAYVDRDREEIRRTHTEDWTGFQGPSTSIERGIDAYMKNADASLQSLKGVGYQLLDTEIKLYGNLAVVYYLARYDYRDLEDRPGQVLLKSVDIYRRPEGGDWNQCGSNITPITTPGQWVGTAGEGSRGGSAGETGEPDFQPVSAENRRQLLTAREQVWRAWFSNDSAALRSLVPAETIAIDPGVEPWADRPEILRRAAGFGASGATLRKLEFPETRIQLYGQVAVLYTRYRFVVESEGKETVSEGRGTEIFVRRNGQWVNSGWHLDSGSD